MVIEFIKENDEVLQFVEQEELCAILDIPENTDEIKIIP